ncbi:MAG: phosphotransferase [Candidatus Coatesbacteria bacterium]
MSNAGQGVAILLELARKALGAYPVAIKRVAFLANHSNHLFRVDAKDGGKYALRITSPIECHGIDEVRSEIAFLEFVRQHAGLRVPEPLRARNGRPVSAVRMPGTGESRPSVLFRWIAGTEVGSDITDETMHMLGACTASLHVHAMHFRPPRGFRIRKLDRVFTYSDKKFPMVEPIVLFDAAFGDEISPDQRRLFHRATRAVQRHLDAMFADRDGLRVLHNDLHFYNVRMCRGRMHLIDFEDLAWGYPIQDIATTFNELPHDGRRRGFIRSYMEGYATIAPWPRDAATHLDAMMAGRCLMLLNWRLANNMGGSYQTTVERQLRKYLARGL